MYNRKLQEKILKRLDKLEDKYDLQESQVLNLLELFQEYHTELDRRRDQYNSLLRKVGMVGVFAFGVSIPFI